MATAIAEIRRCYPVSAGGMGGLRALGFGTIPTVVGTGGRRLFLVYLVPGGEDGQEEAVELGRAGAADVGGDFAPAGRSRRKMPTGPRRSGKSRNPGGTDDFAHKRSARRGKLVRKIVGVAQQREVI